MLLFAPETRGDFAQQVGFVFATATAVSPRGLVENGPRRPRWCEEKQHWSLFRFQLVRLAGQMTIGSES
jgi:hypothetical protein